MAENTEVKNEIVQVDDSFRIKLILALGNRRASRAELGEARAKAQALIATLDKDGALMKLINEADALSGKYQESENSLKAVIDEIQALGVSLEGCNMASDGTITRPVAKP